MLLWYMPEQCTQQGSNSLTFKINATNMTLKPSGLLNSGRFLQCQLIHSYVSLISAQHKIWVNITWTSTMLIVGFKKINFLMSCKTLKKPPTHCPHIPMATNMHRHWAEKSWTYQSFNIHRLRLLWLHLHVFAAFFPPKDKMGAGGKCRNETESALKLLNGFDHMSKANQQLLSASVSLL